MPNLRKFVQISTDEVYGDMEDIRAGKGATESFSLRPSSAYSASKASADLAVIAAARTFNIPYLITRSCNNFGPRQHGEKFLPTLFRCVEEGKNIPVYGDGQQKREWIHVKDNVATIAELMVATSLKNEVFNISSNYHYTNMDIIKKVKKFSKTEVKFDHVEDRKGHDREYKIDCSKLIEYLDDFVFLSLEGYLRDVAREKSLINGR
jgi:dTDP-glucose 4,6-dehydratase